METTRRNFLGVAASIAGATAPLLVGTDDKAGSKAPVVGDGEYKYEVKVIAHLGDGEYSSQEWSKLRTQERDKFTPGKFVCPHSAIFDHAGNIFVVEWVEVGRVTKLRKVA